MKNSTIDLEQVSQFSSKTVSFNSQGVIGKAWPGATTNLDLQVNDDHFLSGGSLRVKNAVFGDYCDVQLVDRDMLFVNVQVPGAPAGFTYGQISGYPVVRQFVTNWYLTDTETKQADINLPYASKVLAGFYIRLVYHSIAHSTDDSATAAFNYYLHRVLA